MRAIVPLVLAPGLFLLVGCGVGKHPTAPVSGLVTLKGKALAGGKVIFMHDSGRFGHGDIGTDGRYKLQAPLGPCKVAISWREDPPPNRKEPGLYVPKSLIPERYEDHLNSGLKFDVKKEANEANWPLEE